MDDEPPSQDTSAVFQPDGVMYLMATYISRDTFDEAHHSNAGIAPVQGT